MTGIKQKQWHHNDILVRKIFFLGTYFPCSIRGWNSIGMDGLGEDVHIQLMPECVLHR